MGGSSRIASGGVHQRLFAPFLTAVKVPIHGAGCCLYPACSQSHAVDGCGHATPDHVGLRGLHERGVACPHWHCRARARAWSIPSRFTAIGQWIRRASQAGLARLRAPWDPIADSTALTGSARFHASGSERPVEHILRIGYIEKDLITVTGGIPSEAMNATPITSPVSIG